MTTPLSVPIAHLAAHTERIRLASGGVMLPNHARLAVAERFGMLAALHPAAPEHVAATWEMSPRALV